MANEKKERLERIRRQREAREAEEAKTTEEDGVPEQNPFQPLNKHIANKEKVGITCISMWGDHTHVNCICKSFIPQNDSATCQLFDAEHNVIPVWFYTRDYPT